MVEQGTHKPLDVSSNLTLATISIAVQAGFHPNPVQLLVLIYT